MGKNNWIDIKHFKPHNSCYVWVFAHDIVNQFVVKAHAYVCPEYGNIMFEDPESREELPIMVMNVMHYCIREPQPPKA